MDNNYSSELTDNFVFALNALSLDVSAYEIEAIGEFSQFDITSYEVEVLGADRLVSPFSLDVSTYEIEAIGEFSQSQISYYGVEVLGSNLFRERVSFIGGFTLRGSSLAVRNAFSHNIIGGFTLGGGSQTSFRIIKNYQALGGFVTSGQALNKEINVSQSIGELVFSGNSVCNYKINFNYTSVGSINFSGTTIKTESNLIIYFPKIEHKKATALFYYSINHGVGKSIYCRSYEEKAIKPIDRINT